MINQHFVTSNEIVDLSNNHQLLLNSQRDNQTLHDFKAVLPQTANQPDSLQAYRSNFQYLGNTGDRGTC